VNIPDFFIVPAACKYISRGISSRTYDFLLSGTISIWDVDRPIDVFSGTFNNTGVQSGDV